MNVDFKEVIGVVTVSVVLVLLLKNPSGTVQIIDSLAKGFGTTVGTLQGNQSSNGIPSIANT